MVTFQGKWIRLHGMKPLNVFEYVDYRRYLKDYFDFQKSKSHAFSHRFLANKLGLATPNFILLVIQGKRNITSETCSKLSEVMDLTDKEAEYFENMVNYDQARRPKEKDRYYSRIMSSRQAMKIEKLEDWQYEYFSNWYTPIIRDMVIQGDFKGDFKALASRITPAVTLAQVKRSLKLLVKLGLIKLEGNKYVPQSPFVSTGPEVNSTAVVNFHRNMVRLAGEAIDRHPKNQRNISSCTVNISEEVYKKLADKITSFRKDVMAIAETSGNPDRIYQMNFQLFPLTKPVNQGK